MRFSRLLVTIGLAAIAAPFTTNAQATQPPAATVRIKDSLDLKASPELQKALDSLAAAVQALAIRVATDPQLRMAAIQVASGFVLTAQQVVTENSDVLQEALRTAAERIAAVQTIESQRKKKQ